MQIKFYTKTKIIRRLLLVAFFFLSLPKSLWANSAYDIIGLSEILNEKNIGFYSDTSSSIQFLHEWNGILETEDSHKITAKNTLSNFSGTFYFAPLFLCKLEVNSPDYSASIISGDKDSLSLKSEMRSYSTTFQFQRSLQKHLNYIQLHYKYIDPIHLFGLDYGIIHQDRSIQLSWQQDYDSYAINVITDQLGNLQSFKIYHQQLLNQIKLNGQIKIGKSNQKITLAYSEGKPIQDNKKRSLEMAQKTAMANWNVTYPLIYNSNWLFNYKVLQSNVLSKGIRSESGDRKRFHYGIENIHIQGFKLAIPFDSFKISPGFFYLNAKYSPGDEALSERKETLNFNRFLDPDLSWFLTSQYYNKSLLNHSDLDYYQFPIMVKYNASISKCRYGIEFNHSAHNFTLKMNTAQYTKGIFGYSEDTKSINQYFIKALSLTPKLFFQINLTSSLRVEASFAQFIPYYLQVSSQNNSSESASSSHPIDFMRNQFSPFKDGFSSNLLVKYEW